MASEIASQPDFELSAKIFEASICLETVDTMRLTRMSTAAESASGTRSRVKTLKSPRVRITATGRYVAVQNATDTAITLRLDCWAAKITPTTKLLSPSTRCHVRRADAYNRPQNIGNACDDARKI